MCFMQQKARHWEKAEWDKALLECQEEADAQIDVFHRPLLVRCLPAQGMEARGELGWEVEGQAPAGSIVPRWPECNQPNRDPRRVAKLVDTRRSTEMEPHKRITPLLASQSRSAAPDVGWDNWKAQPRSGGPAAAPLPARTSSGSAAASSSGPERPSYVTDRGGPAEALASYRERSRSGPKQSNAVRPDPALPPAPAFWAPVATAQMREYERLYRDESVGRKRERQIQLDKETAAWLSYLPVSGVAATPWDRRAAPEEGTGPSADFRSEFPVLQPPPPRGGHDHTFWAQNRKMAGFKKVNFVILATFVVSTWPCVENKRQFPRNYMDN